MWNFNLNDPNALDRTLRSLSGNYRPRSLARYLWPDPAVQPKRPLLAIGDLRAFAWNGYLAKTYRLAGDIPKALYYENVNDMLYTDLDPACRDYADMLSIEQDMSFPPSSFQGLS